MYLRQPQEQLCTTASSEALLFQIRCYDCRAQIKWSNLHLLWICNVSFQVMMSFDIFDTSFSLEWLKKTMKSCRHKLPMDFLPAPICAKTEQVVHLKTLAAATTHRNLHDCKTGSRTATEEQVRNLPQLTSKAQLLYKAAACLNCCLEEDPVFCKRTPHLRTGPRALSTDRHLCESLQQFLPAPCLWLDIKSSSLGTTGKCPCKEKNVARGHCSLCFCLCNRFLSLCSEN